jgi:hypothetical protein
VVEETETKVLVHLLLVDLASEGLVLQDRLDLRREDDPAVVPSVKEGLDPEVVAREHHPRHRRTLVENREPPHAVEAAEAIGPPLREGVEHHLGVARGVKGVSRRFQLRAQLAKVVDLAVVDDLQLAVVHRHRLAAVREVDDAEPAESERRDGILEMPVIVRTSMPERLGHRLEQGPVGCPPEARYPAHVSGSPASGVVGA